MYMWFETDGSSTLALPSLDGISGLIPIFDLNEQLSIDGETFA